MNGTPKKDEMEREAGTSLASRIVGTTITVFVLMLFALVVFTLAAFVYGMGEEILPAVRQAGTDTIEWVFS